MQMNRRRALIGIGTAALLAAAGRQASADGKLTEENMTQRDYDRITTTENSSAHPESDPKVETTPIHDLTDSERNGMKEEGHAARVIKGKEWERETPAERDAHLRRIKATAPEGSTFLVEVPSGNVWLLPPQTEGNADYLDRYVYRRWYKFQKEGLPVAVAPEGTSHTDTHGTSFARITIRERF